MSDKRDGVLNDVGRHSKEWKDESSESFDSTEEAKLNLAAELWSLAVVYYASENQSIDWIFNELRRRARISVEERVYALGFSMSQLVDEEHCLQAVNALLENRSVDKSTLPGIRACLDKLSYQELRKDITKLHSMDRVHIWDSRQRLWWRADYFGYTDNLLEAGVYQLKEVYNSLEFLNPKARVTFVKAPPTPKVDYLFSKLVTQLSHCKQALSKCKDYLKSATSRYESLMASTLILGEAPRDDAKNETLNREYFQLRELLRIVTEEIP